MTGKTFCDEFSPVICPIAVVLITLATSTLGIFVFKAEFDVNSFIALGLIGGATALAMLTAALVAWGPLCVRPLEVLHYE